MALFNFRKKKKEEKKATACCCGSTEAQTGEPAGCCCGSAPKAQETSCCCGSAPKAQETSCCCGAPVDGICCIKVLGAGCKSCHEQYENAKAAVKAMGLDVEVEYITDMEKVMGYGVMSMPAIVVNEKVVSMGKVLNTSEVKKLLRKLGV